MGFKQIYRERKLRQELAKIQRSPVVHNIDDIKKVGVIWQPSQKEAVSYLRNYFNKNHIIFRTYCVFDNLSNPNVANNTLTVKRPKLVGHSQTRKNQGFSANAFRCFAEYSARAKFCTRLYHSHFPCRFKSGLVAQRNELLRPKH